MKLIHMADVHLNRMPEEREGIGTIRKQEIQDTFDQVLIQAKKEKVDCILIAGDLYDHPPMTEELKELNARFKKLSPITIVLIAGNHDFVEENGSYERFEFAENVIFLKSKTLQSHYVESLNTTFWGFSYHQKEIRESLYDRIEPVKGEGYHILLAHGGDEAHIPIDYERLKWLGFDYIALGHIHKQEQIVEDFMGYSGSLEPLDRTEKGEHGYYLVDISEEGQRMTFVPAAKRSYEVIEVEVEEDETLFDLTGRIEDEMIERGRQNFYEIHVTGYTSLSKKFSFEALEKKYYIIDILDETMKDYDENELYEENKENILGMFIEEIRSLSDPYKEEAMTMGIEALLHTKVK